LHGALTTSTLQLTGWLGKNTPPSSFFGKNAWTGVPAASAGAISGAGEEENQGTVKVLTDRIIGNGTFGVVYEGRCAGVSMCIHACALLSKYESGPLCKRKHARRMIMANGIRKDEASWFSRVARRSRAGVACEMRFSFESYQVTWMLRAATRYLQHLYVCAVFDKRIQGCIHPCAHACAYVCLVHLRISRRSDDISKRISRN
jgi:hypothetical protein